MEVKRIRRIRVVSGIKSTTLQQSLSSIPSIELSSLIKEKIKYPFSVAVDTYNKSIQPDPGFKSFIHCTLIISFDQSLFHHEKCKHMTAIQVRLLTTKDTIVNQKKMPIDVIHKSSIGTKRVIRFPLYFHKELDTNAKIILLFYSLDSTDDESHKVWGHFGITTIEIQKLISQKRTDMCAIRLIGESHITLATFKMSIEGGENFYQLTITNHLIEKQDTKFEQLVTRYRNAFDVMTRPLRILTTFETKEMVDNSTQVVSIPYADITGMPMSMYFASHQFVSGFPHETIINGFLDNLLNIWLYTRNIQYRQLNSYNRGELSFLLAEIILMIPSLIGYTTDRYAEDFSFPFLSSELGYAQADCEDLNVMIGFIVRMIRNSTTKRFGLLRSLLQSKTLLHLHITTGGGEEKEDKTVSHIISVLVDNQWFSDRISSSSSSSSSSYPSHILLEPMARVEPIVIDVPPTGTGLLQTDVDAILHPFFKQSDVMSTTYRDVIRVYLADNEKIGEYFIYDKSNATMGCSVKEFMDGLSADRRLKTAYTFNPSEMTIIRDKLQQIDIVVNFDFKSHKTRDLIDTLSPISHASNTEFYTILVNSGSAQDTVAIRKKLDRAVNRTRNSKKELYDLNYKIDPTPIYLCESMYARVVYLYMKNQASDDSYIHSFPRSIPSAKKINVIVKNIS
jgi:hypothetical protein